MKRYRLSWLAAGLLIARTAAAGEPTPATAASAEPLPAKPYAAGMDPGFRSPAEPDAYPEGRIKLFGRRYSLALSATLFTPGSGATRESFGASILLPGMMLFRPETKGGPRFDIDLAGRLLAKDGRRALVLAPTLGVRMNLAGAGRAVVPFISVRTGPYFARTAGATPSTPGQGASAAQSTSPADAGFRVLAGGNAQAGLEIRRWVVVAGRYDRVQDSGGVDLSGWTAEAMVRVF